MNIEVQKAIENVRLVDADRNYWFIRSYGGQMFQDFVQRKYVGIGLNEVPFEYLNEYKEADDDNKSYNRIRNFIEKNTAYKDGEATKWANQLINFQHKAKKGDLVIVPNKNSSYFHIGVIESEVYQVNEDLTFFHNKKYEKFPDKRRDVRWEKLISRHDVRADLRGMTSTHQAITLVNKYSEGIEGHISSIYIKEDKMHLVIKVNQDEDINAFDLKDFLSSITFFYKEFCAEEGIDVEDLTIKIKLQSKGKLALKAAVYGGVFGIASLILLSNDNEFKAEVAGQKIEFKTGDGLLKSISDFKDASQKRKMEYEIFKNSMKNLKVKVVDEKDDELNNDVANDSIENGEADNGKNNSAND
ncbi:hypothetical protein [Changchengzhania lutea]|uniref:hypothetical protein n=1 Tax=Changchengzhania lutea TaxID=2049305 RepID=UPI00115C5ED4|nr:hypothetical protein [Changchengzhania lutea]